MEIVIDLPEAFEGHFKQDRFKDSLERLIEDANLLAGNYEIETAEMLIMAFANGTPLPKHHGRLGDLDVLEAEMINGIKAGNYEEGYEKYQHINDIDDCIECVHYADTIIEADRGE